MRLTLLLLSIVIGSCVNAPLDPALDGTYCGSNGEILHFNQGRVDHVRRSNGINQKTFVGIVRNSDGAINQWEVFGPDISPFIGTRFEFDYSTRKVAVNWRDPRPQAVARESSYRKTSNGEQAAP
jgi:hypothetical protein